MTRLMRALTIYVERVVQHQPQYGWLQEIIDELPTPAPARLPGYGAHCDYRR